MLSGSEVSCIYSYTPIHPSEFCISYSRRQRNSFILHSSNSHRICTPSNRDTCVCNAFWSIKANATGEASQRRGLLPYKPAPTHKAR